MEEWNEKAKRKCEMKKRNERAKRGSAESSRYLADGKDNRKDSVQREREACRMRETL